MDAWLIPFITVISAACGGVIGSVIKLKSENQRHYFNLKADAYKNLITAYREHIASDKSNSDYEKFRQKYVEAQEQVELIGSVEVIDLSKSFYTADPRFCEQIF